MAQVEDLLMRQYETGATRGSQKDKLSYSRFLDPGVLTEFCEYMQTHRFQIDGTVRDPDNWKKGILKDDYIDSLVRHTFDLWRAWNNGDIITDPDRGTVMTMRDLMCAIMFNVMGLLYEARKEDE